jgi:hypothetical protein
VLRDSNGKRVQDYYPYFFDDASVLNLTAGTPVRVFSCWNGMASFRAHPFFDQYRLRFRANRPAEPAAVDLISHYDKVDFVVEYDQLNNLNKC